VFVNLGGGSVGLQAGVESTDVVLVFRDRRSLTRLLEGKGKVTLGADVAVAAGPVGRQAMAGTDARLEAEILSYSRSRGLFAGVSLDGTVIRPDANSNAMFRADTRVEVAREVAALKAALDAMARPQPAAPPVLLPPTPVLPPARP
jgi:lipid-binding SYLF domain-containing protein